MLVTFLLASSNSFLMWSYMYSGGADAPLTRPRRKNVTLEKSI